MISRKAKLLALAKKLPNTGTKAKDPKAKQRQKISLTSFRASFTNVSRCHLYVTTELGCTIPIQTDSPEGWKALYEAAIEAEATRTLSTAAPTRPRLALVDSEYESLCEDEDAQLYSSGGANQFLGAS